MNQESDNGVVQISRGVMSGLATTPMTQSSTAMAEIKNHILTKGLHPDDVLPAESQLCTDLGVSRSSMHEAVHTLVALDIVEIRHRHGMFVSQVSVHPMVESLIFRGLLNPEDNRHGLRGIVGMRITLDNALAEPVIHAWHNLHDPELNTLVDNVKHLASQGKLFIDQDRCFRTRLLQPLDNHLYLHLTKAFWTIHTLTVPLLDTLKFESLTSAAKAHRAMFQAAHAGGTPAYHKAITGRCAPFLAVLT